MTDQASIAMIDDIALLAFLAASYRSILRIEPWLLRFQIGYNKEPSNFRVDFESQNDTENG